MWVIKQRYDKFVVGYYYDSNYDTVEFESLYVFDTIEEAESKVHYLNGGN